MRVRASAACAHRAMQCGLSRTGAAFDIRAAVEQERDCEVAARVLGNAVECGVTFSDRYGMPIPRQHNGVRVFDFMEYLFLEGLPSLIC